MTPQKFREKCLWPAKMGEMLPSFGVRAMDSLKSIDHLSTLVADTSLFAALPSGKLKSQDTHTIPISTNSESSIVMWNCHRVYQVSHDLDTFMMWDLSWCPHFGTQRLAKAEIEKNSRSLWGKTRSGWKDRGFLQFLPLWFPDARALPLRSQRLPNSSRQLNPTDGAFGPAWGCGHPTHHKHGPFWATRQLQSSS